MKRTKVGPALKFGEEVHRIRRGMELTIDELSAETGLSRALISDVERGRRAPTARTVEALAGRLDPDGRGDGLAALAARTYGRVEFDLAGVDPERIDALVRLGRRLLRAEPGPLEVIRSSLAGVD